MKLIALAACGLLVAHATAGAAMKCPTIETAMVDKGFGEFAPWHVMSGGQGECSFMTANTQVNFGFSHMVAEDADKAKAAAVEMKEAVAAKSVLEPLPVLGDEGFSYQPKDDNGKVDPTSMFFFGHRGPLSVSGYLNLKGTITPAQRDFAANLIASTLGAATNAKALAKESECRYFDAGLVKRLLPEGAVSTIVPDANNCIVSAGGGVITFSIVSNPRIRESATIRMKTSGCTVDALPKLGSPAGILHHCSGGNARAQVLLVAGSRLFDVTFVPGREPSDDERSVLVQMAEFAARH
ncbi:MAG: hypothetical protein ABI846_05025 [Rudaea sp.]